MKSSRVLLSCLLSIVFASAASAAWIPLTGAPVSVSSLEGGSLIFGDKELSEIELFGFATGGAIEPDADSVFVQGGQNSVTGDYGLRFNFSWSAISNQIVNTTLSFKVSILPGFDDYFIKDVWLNITGASANGTGGVHVGETVWDTPFFDPEGNIIASLSCSKQEDDGGAYLADYAEFAPLKEIWIHSKDISVTGGTDGTAHLSEFFQFYSQIPEPATLVLLGTAGAWIFTRKRWSV
jgi:hypothetical protein